MDAIVNGPLLLGLLLALLSTVALDVGFLLQHHAASRMPRLQLRHPLNSARSLLGARHWTVGFAIGLAGWASPSGNSVAAHVLQRLALFTNVPRYRNCAERTIKLLANSISRYPNAFGHLLCAIDLYVSNPYEIAIIGGRENSLIDAVFTHYIPNKVVAVVGSLSLRS